MQHNNNQEKYAFFVKNMYNRLSHQVDIYEYIPQVEF